VLDKNKGNDDPKKAKKRALLQLVAAVNDADEEYDLEEDLYLRKVAAAIGLVFLPTTLLGLSAYYFPPVPGSRLSWFPAAWTGLAFLSHLGIVLWLVAEFYQFPVGTYFRAWARRIRRR